MTNSMIIITTSISSSNSSLLTVTCRAVIIFHYWSLKVRVWHDQVSNCCWNLTIDRVPGKNSNSQFFCPAAGAIAATSAAIAVDAALVSQDMGSAVFGCRADCSLLWLSLVV